mmetsp:Transcript_18625/g.33705  ORF Transcript_18625/g.33705 Transcript_18625/m.33705 type:complete len:646 (+) Transcript_18625:133-2070(+)
MSSTMATFHRIIAMLITTAVILNIDASSNTVAITHRSYIGDYSNGLNVVKRHEEEEEEYVTSFYTRVRDKRRAMFGRQLQQHDNEQLQQGANLDHSLDHYFDQLLLSSSRSKMKSEAKVTSSGQSSSAARRVRGGAASRLTRPSSAKHLNHDVAGEHGHYQAAASSAYAAAASAEGESSKSGSSSSHFGRQRNHSHHSQPRARSHSSHQSRQNIHHSHRQNRSEGQNYDVGQFDAQDYNNYNSANYNGHYDDYDDNESHRSRDADEQAADEGDDYPEHHLGLLRVPCSIAINSEEASLGHHHQHDCSSQAKMPMAAYVDTGAQVTIISASAAKRAGIYHLMDRRYAGRATGVGHCKVLGRIPARHVYFILGEGCDDEYDGYGRDCRGGEQGYYQDENSNMVQMDGPALTVLEGTVTQGVDILFGLDVLQDWEAEIRMGPRKSITVKKRRNRNSYSDSGDSVVIPFASRQSSSARRYSRKEERASSSASRHSDIDRHPHRSHSRIAHVTSRHSHPSSMTHRRHRSNAHNDNFSDFEDDIDNIADEFEDDIGDIYDDDFSPTDSDIESDLDLLDQSGHEFPEESRSFVSTKSMQEMEDELMGVQSVRSEWDDMKEDVEDDGDDYLQDVDEDEDIMLDGDTEIDLSGL